MIYFSDFWWFIGVGGFVGKLKAFGKFSKGFERLTEFDGVLTEFDGVLTEFDGV